MCVCGWNDMRRAIPTPSQSSLTVREDPAKKLVRLNRRDGTKLTFPRARILRLQSEPEIRLRAIGRQGNGRNLKTERGMQPSTWDASKFKFRRQTPLPHSLFLPSSNPWRLLIASERCTAQSSIWIWSVHSKLSPNLPLFPFSWLHRVNRQAGRHSGQGTEIIARC